MKYLNLIFIVLFSGIQQFSESKFKITELGFSFEKPNWYGTKNENFTSTLKKYNWNVESAINSVAAGSIEIVRYHKSNLNKDKKVFLGVSVGGLHKSLRDFDKLLKFKKGIKIAAPNIKILQQPTPVIIGGRKAIVHFMSHTESDGKGKSYKLFSKSISIFMGNYNYDVSIQTKDIKDIDMFDALIKTIKLSDK